MLNLKMLEGMGKTQVLCLSKEQAEEFCREMWEQYPSRMKPAWDQGQTNWRKNSVQIFYLPRIDYNPGEADFCQSSSYSVFGYKTIAFSDLVVIMDFGDIQTSDQDMKSLFGME